MPENSALQLKIAVCDDEPIDRQQAAGLTREIMAEEGAPCSLTIYESAADLLAAIQGGEQFHILLLDVMMEGLDGMELAAALRELGDGAAVIFVSSNREMALRGYEVSAARYLAKPIQRQRLQEALLYCYKTFCENRDILLPTEKGRSRLSPSSIIYAEPWERVEAPAHQRSNRNHREIFRPGGDPAGADLHPLPPVCPGQPRLCQASAPQ